MSGLLDGKVTIVTGAAGGIGSVVCELFAKEGAKILATDINGEGVAAVARKINQAGGRAEAMEVDTSSEEQVKAMVDRAVKVFGRLDCAMNNVGIGLGNAPVTELERADFEKVFAVNVIGTWLCMKYEIPRMIEAGGGAIVNMASLSGILGIPNGAIYTSSKHAVIGLTKSASAEFGLQGVRVNAICPGVVMTPMMKEAAKAGMDFVKMNPNALNRGAEPAEVGELALWLLSSRSSHITGQAINIDGGKTAATFFLHQFA